MADRIDDLERIRAEHPPSKLGGVCAHCKKHWPCDTAKVLEALDRLEECFAHGCACDWHDGIPGVKTRPADDECEYHGKLREAPAIAVALREVRRGVRCEIGKFLRREANVKHDARIPGHAMLLASFRQLADRIEGGAK